MDAALEVWWSLYLGEGWAQWSRSIVESSCQDQEQLLRAVVTIKSHCQAQVVIDQIKSRAEQKQLPRAVVKIRSNRQSEAEAIVKCDRQKQSSERSRSKRQV